MESVSNVEKKWRTRQEKDEFFFQWKRSGKSRKVFCQEQGLNYNSFVTWNKEQKSKLKAGSGFSEITVPSRFKMVQENFNVATTDIQNLFYCLVDYRCNFCVFNSFLVHEWNNSR